MPKTGGLNLSWVARALSGRPFTLTNGNVDPDLNGIQAEPLPAGELQRQRPTDAYTVKNYKAERNGAYGPGLLRPRHAVRLPDSARQQRRLELSADVFNLTNHTNFANPIGQPGVGARSCF